VRISAAVSLSASILAGCTLVIDAREATYAPDDAAPDDAALTPKAAPPTTKPTLAPNESLIELADAQLDDNFGTEVVLQGDELIVAAANATLLHTRSSAAGACGDEVDAKGAGRVVEFQWSTLRQPRPGAVPEGVWRQTGELHRTGVHEGEATVHYAGMTLPRIAVARAGDTVAVGVPGAYVTECDGAGTTLAEAGKVHIFVRVGGRWEVEAVLTERDPSPSAFFGASVQLNDTELFVGANAADGLGSDAGTSDATLTNNGAVYVFARQGGAWRETQRIVPKNPMQEGHFGNSLSLHGDTLAVGAWFDSHAERGIHQALDGDGAGPAVTDAEFVDRSGAAYTFRKRDGRWEQEAYFKAFNRAANTGFGTAVALDDDFLFVGAPAESGGHATATAAQVEAGVIAADPESAANAGAVYAYERGERGWKLHSYLKAFEPRAGGIFGMTVAAHSGRVLIGSPWESVAGSNGWRAGAAYLFARADDSFAPVRVFGSAFPSPDLHIGHAVALSDRYAVAGAPTDDLGPGTVSIFELEP
jgi:FG-GAP repeat